jgi:hypothetical protein
MNCPGPLTEHMGADPRPQRGPSMLQFGRGGYLTTAEIGKRALAAFGGCRWRYCIRCNMSARNASRRFDLALLTSEGAIDGDRNEAARS